MPSKLVSLPRYKTYTMDLNESQRIDLNAKALRLEAEIQELEKEIP